jgi:YVTN family beta-propeller protein
MVALSSTARSPRLARTATVAAIATVAASAAALAPVFEPTASATTTYAVTATIGVGHLGSGGSIAVDSGTHRAYVTSYLDGRVAVLDTSTNSLVGSIVVGTGPVGVAIDTIPTQVVKQLVIAEPAIAALPTLVSAPTVYVSNYGSGTISVIDSSTNAVVATIPLSNDLPQDLAVDTSSHTLYAAGVKSPTGGVISVVDGVHRTLSSTVPSTGYFQHVAVDSSTHKVYASGCCEQTLWELDGPTDTVVANIAVPGTAGVATNPLTHTVYVANADAAGVVSVIDESTDLITASVPVGRSPQGVAVDTSANTIYVSNIADNTVSVIDGATNTVTATVPAGLSPDAIAVDPATHTAYVLNSASDTVSVITRTVTGAASRLAGSDRFGTSVAVSKAEFPSGGAGAVVLARGDDYPDALVGAPLAAAKNAPLLLTSGSTLPAAIKAEIQRVLAPGDTVYVLGGSNAVPTSVETELTGLGYQVTRYSGADRFETAVKVADALGDPGTVLLATGVNFPDALTAGVAAVKAGGVVLLTNGSTLPAETSAYLAAHPGTVYAIGGPAASADPSATPIYGSDRFETAVDVATKFFSAPTEVGIATGLSFADALSGGALLGHVTAPLLLVGPSSVPGSVTTYLASVKGTITTGYLFGGPNTVNQSVADAINITLGG